MNRLLFLVISCILTVWGGTLPSDKHVPRRQHKIFLDNNESGSFEIFYEINPKLRIGCRGDIKMGQEEVSELYVEDDAGLQRAGRPGLSGTSKLRLLVVPDHRPDMRGGDQSVGQMGLDEFKPWPRECVVGLLRYKISDLVAEETHTDANSGLRKVNAYRVAPLLESKTKKVFYVLTWDWLRDLVYGPSPPPVTPDKPCDTCPTWGEGGPLQGGLNNDLSCSYLDVKVSNGVVSVHPQPDADKTAPQLPQDEVPSETISINASPEEAEISEPMDSEDGLKFIANSTEPDVVNDSSKNGGGFRHPSITITVGGGGGGGGGGSLSPGGAGGDANGLSIATANSNFNTGFYACNSDQVEFYGNVIGVRDPCGGAQLKVYTEFNNSC